MKKYHLTCDILTFARFKKTLSFGINSQKIK